MSLEIGQKIVLSDGRQGIIKYINPRIETVHEYMTGDMYPTGSYIRQEVTVILTTGLLLRTMVRTGSSYHYGTTTWRYFEI